MRRHELPAVTLCLLTVIVMLTSATTALAKIVVDKSIDGVAIGSSFSSVRRTLGKPTHTDECASYPFSGYCGPGQKFWNYDPRDLQIFFLRGRVTSLTTTSKKERTSKGIGPGVSTLRAKRSYPGGKIAPYSGANGYWWPTVPKDGALFTVFLGSAQTAYRGTISIVEVGRWQGKYACDFYSC